MSEPDESGPPWPSRSSRPDRAPKSKTDAETQTGASPLTTSMILNDEEHTFDYVIELLIKLFRHSLRDGRGADLADPHHRPGRRLHDPQGAGRAEARPGPRLRARPADERSPRARSAATSSRRPAD